MSLESAAGMSENRIYQDDSMCIKCKHFNVLCQNCCCIVVARATCGLCLPERRADCRCQSGVQDRREHTTAVWGRGVVQLLY